VHARPAPVALGQRVDDKADARAEHPQSFAIAVSFAQAERVENSGLVARTKARYEAVQALKAQGKGIKPIMRELAGQGDRAPLLCPRRLRSCVGVSVH
jgi:hypothetical protein